MFTARFKPISQWSDWSSAIQFIDKATGLPIDLTGGNVPNSYSLYAKLEPGGYPVLQGSTATGEITTPSLGILQIYFPATRIRTMQPGSYSIGLSVTNGIYTREIFTGLLPIVGLGRPDGGWGPKNNWGWGDYR